MTDVIARAKEWLAGYQGDADADIEDVRATHTLIRDLLALVEAAPPVDLTPWVQHLPKCQSRNARCVDIGEYEQPFPCSCGLGAARRADAGGGT